MWQVLDYTIHTFALLYTTSVGCPLVANALAVTPIAPWLYVLSVTLAIFWLFTYSVIVFPIATTAMRLVWFSPWRIAGLGAIARRS